MSSHCPASALSLPRGPRPGAAGPVLGASRARPLPPLLHRFLMTKSILLPSQNPTCGSARRALGVSVSACVPASGRELIAEFHLTEWPVTCAALYKAETKMCHLDKVVDFTVSKVVMGIL